MIEKFLFQHLDADGNVTSSIPTKTFKEIANYLNIEYFQARQLYLHCKSNTKAHPFIKMLAQKVRVIDNPDILANCFP